jgi:hypothetical protein
MAALLRGLAVRSEADLDQRQRLQKDFFPEGLTGAYGEFRTAVTCPYFSNLEGTSGAGSVW